jgi:hypothetical protein
MHVCVRVRVHACLRAQGAVRRNILNAEMFVHEHLVLANSEMPFLCPR